MREIDPLGTGKTASPLIVKVPDNCRDERSYIISVLLGEFLDMDFQVYFTNRDTVSIADENGREIVMTDAFFSNCQEKWLRDESLPLTPLHIWDVGNLKTEVKTTNQHIPVIYGSDIRDPNFFKSENGRILLGIDIFGSAFFMLTRYEENIIKERDCFGRFPGKASLAYKENFLYRPIINEYLEILWSCIQLLWPGTSRKKREFRTLPTHDVDFPFKYLYAPAYRIAVALGKELAVKKDPFTFLRSLLTVTRVKMGKLSDDPFYVFDALMDVNEKSGLISTFFFIADKTGTVHDCDYSLNSKAIQSLMQRIHEREHEIGLHGSYSSYQDPIQLKKEFDLLRSVCSDNGIRQANWGNRQHALRWETPATFAHLNTIGINYDSTLTFADHAGFRCGICYEYPVYDIESRKPLLLREKPLIVMECSVIDERYMNFGTGEKAFDFMKKLKEDCRLFDGDFTILWHNSRFVDKKEISLYETIIRC